MCGNYFLNLTLLLLMVSVHCNNAVPQEKSANVTEINSDQCIHGPYFKKIIKSIYYGDIQGLHKITELAEISDDGNFIAGVLFGLYDAMNERNETANLFKALDLYTHIDKLYYRYYRPNDRKKLLLIQQDLMRRTIIPKGSLLLQSNIYMDGFHWGNTAVDAMLQKLSVDYDSLDGIIKHMIENVHWLSHHELIAIVANLTTDMERNLRSVILLNDILKLQDNDKYFLAMHLAQLFDKYVNTRRDHEKLEEIVDDIVPAPLRKLLKGKVCFNQKRSDGARYYMHKCYYSNKMCLFPFDGRNTDKAMFVVEISRTPMMFSFRNVDNKEALVLQPGHDESLKDRPYEVFSTKDDNAADIQWKVGLDGEQVVLQNLESTKYVCANNRVPYLPPFHEDIVFTKNQTGFQLDIEECKWFIDSCID